jgi:hypothetical protein
MNTQRERRIRRDPYAKEVRTPKYRQRVVPDAKKYNREKEKRECFDDQEGYDIPGD